MFFKIIAASELGSLKARKRAISYVPEHKGSLVICSPVTLNQTFAERNQDAPSKGINLSTANETVADEKLIFYSVLTTQPPT